MHVDGVVEMEWGGGVGGGWVVFVVGLEPGWDAPEGNGGVAG